MAASIIASPITINGISVSLETALLGLDGAFRDGVSDLKDFIPGLFQNYERKGRKVRAGKIDVFGGVPDAQEWNGGEGGKPIPAQGFSKLWQVQYYLQWYANAISWDINAQTFDQYDLMKDNSKELAKSMHAKRQTLAAASYYNAFINNGPDGVPIFSQYHPYAPNAVIQPGYAGVQCNVVQGTVSATTYAAAKQLLIGQNDAMGRPRNLKPRVLRCHSTFAEAWEQVLGRYENRIYQGPLNSGSSSITPNIGAVPSNANNVIQNTNKDDGVIIEPWDWIRPIDSAFLFGSEWGAKKIDAVPITPKTRDADHNDDYSITLESIFCSAFFWLNWYGVIGITGASLVAQ